jgi:hypothetical protein
MNLIGAFAGRILDNVQRVKKVYVNDTLRFVGFEQKKDLKVIIDGKEYPSSILTEIGPRCMESSSGNTNTITIKTKNNKILYALEFEKRNARVAQAAFKNNKVYTRFIQEYEDGSRYCIAMLKDGHGSSASTSVSLKGRVLIIIEGKRYREKDLKNLTRDSELVRNITSISFTNKTYVDELDPENSKGYEVVLEATASN